MPSREGRRGGDGLITCVLSVHWVGHGDCRSAVVYARSDAPNDLESRHPDAPSPGGAVPRRPPVGRPGVVRPGPRPRCRPGPGRRPLGLRRGAAPAGPGEASGRLRASRLPRAPRTGTAPELARCRLRVCRVVGLCALARCRLRALTRCGFRAPRAARLAPPPWRRRPGAPRVRRHRGGLASRRRSGNPEARGSNARDRGPRRLPGLASLQPQPARLSPARPLSHHPHAGLRVRPVPPGRAWRALVLRGGPTALPARRRRARATRPRVRVAATRAGRSGRRPVGDR